MVHAGCVFVAGIHLSRTWTSGSFESMRWNARVHRLDLRLYSHPKEYIWNGVRTHVNSREKIPSAGKILPRGGSNTQHCIKQYREPNTLPTSYSGRVGVLPLGYWSNKQSIGNSFNSSSQLTVMWARTKKKQTYIIQQSPQPQQQEESNQLCEKW